MLVITRRSNEGVWIGKDIFVMVQVRGGQVRMLIEAPKDVHILRDELKKRDEKGGGKCGRTSR